jgi:putative transcriptional regulator
MFKNYFELYKKLSKNHTPISAKELKAIRKMYNLSQASFAKLLRISVKTLQNYEIERRRPSSTATALFWFAKKYPNVFLQGLTGDNRPFFM